MTEVSSIRVESVVFRTDLYPRLETDPALVQRYAANLDVLPPIEINQDNILIDGWHRWTAHRKNEVEMIAATVTHTASDLEIDILAAERNSTDGWQLSEPSKRKKAIKWFAAGTGLDKERIAKALSVTPRMVSEYLQDIEKKLREERKAQIFAMWLACYTEDEIAEAVGIDQKTVNREIETFSQNGSASELTKSRDFGSDADWNPPLYNVWTFAAKTNKVSHFGNSEQRILEKLLYLYTDPFDIVVDPFAGGGATIDVCTHRLRRYWVSDRKPAVERGGAIREHDIVTGGVPPLHNRWSDVSLTYLDPPYWKQAEGEYSKDANDLANMSREDFTQTLSRFIREVSKRQSKGVIAMLMQPTQYKAPDHEWTDHVIDIVSAVGNKRLHLENRVSCPYSTEQCTPQLVEWAKANKKLLCIARELVIWKVIQ